ncbi:hypothetical protein B0T26DRAFT_670592 [Lasiosphaeria miniovina]|uniref:Uncharacterized protein n=1 Tax=Lasiosphaeria miniovina TaxID=1954250 RepID=A0AA40BHS8_9PEZI|nr:uncharacterized protein B0T26DRAFT_670592 [Lasiosphaeria miniovina]KAK0734273.1 hypothetical protein B0T26DRAFT_670592 [Lasiosphaeria miniovina]
MATPKGNTPDDFSQRPPALEEPVIISMLSRPRSSKRTQCQMLSRRFDLAHISIGDVLRLEINCPSSQYANIIRENMIAGRVGPKEITISIGMRAFILDASEAEIESIMSTRTGNRARWGST